MSFPNSMQELANVSKHLTPHTLGIELQKLKRDGFPILLYHLKPAYMDVIQAELQPMLRERELVVPSLGDLYRL